MKLLESICYIHLPDDFEGDEIDALQWYVNYRREETREKTYHELDEKGSEMIIGGYMSYVYRKLVGDKKTRGGILQLKHCVDGEWKEVDEL